MRMVNYRMTQSCLARPHVFLLLSLYSKLVIALFLSDIPTPSFLIDLDVLGKESGERFDRFPEVSLFLPRNGFHLVARDIQGLANVNTEIRLHLDEMSSYRVGGKTPIGLLHSSVTRAREDVTDEDYDSPQETFLAEIDIPPSLCGLLSNMDGTKEDPPAELVLGVNNHHVGPYYWARSAGSGAFMEAPGVEFASTTSISRDKGILRWGNDGGPTDCNSNDGKRSEWVNFLRVGDNVQLLPLNEEDALQSFSNEFSDRIFGYSAKGRPLGAEPVITCKWERIQQLSSN